MAIHDHNLALVFGFLGNAVSFLVYLAPLPTFYRIVKKKSTEEFQSIPYAVALFSAMLMLYYASLKVDGFLLITINSAGCLIESVYLIIYLVYATRTSRIFTAKLLGLFNVGLYALIVLVTTRFTEGAMRVNTVGWICAVFSVCVFAAPLGIIRRVIYTKSVEFMPFTLSFFLTLCAVFWLLYGFFIGDYYVAAPNILGFLFGVMQMILYFIYRDSNTPILPCGAKSSRVKSSQEVASGIREIREIHKIKEEEFKEDHNNVAELNPGSESVIEIGVLRPIQIPIAVN